MEIFDRGTEWVISRGENIFWKSSSISYEHIDRKEKLMKLFMNLEPEDGKNTRGTLEGQF